MDEGKAPQRQQWTRGQVASIHRHAAGHPVRGARSFALDMCHAKYSSTSVDHLETDAGGPPKSFAHLEVVPKGLYVAQLHPCMESLEAEH